MKKSMIALAVLMSMTSFAHAAAQVCDGSESEIRACVDRQYRAADIDLNAAYQKLKLTISQLEAADEIGMRLKAAEQAWIQYRDASCNLERAQFLGGTGETDMVLACLLSKTQDRTKELNSLNKAFSNR